jgi:hypothetical protein
MSKISAMGPTSNEPVAFSKHPLTYQCGFRRNRSTTDQNFCFRQILEKKWEYMDDNIDTIKKNTQTLIDASKEASLKVNREN